MPEAGGKLKQQAAQFGRLHQGHDSRLEFFDLCRGPFMITMRELLPDLHREFKIVRCALSPALCASWITRPVERRIDFNGVEIPGIEFQLISFQQRVEDTGP